MKEANYQTLGGETVTIQYDPSLPCKFCKLPVLEASVSGTEVCPWCDAGVGRDGVRLTLADWHRMLRN